MKNFLPKSNTNSKGFTLIELMVVISIIAFLAVIGIAAYSQTQKTARDGRRKADIDAISQAMESNYNAVTGAYTTIADGMFSSNKQPADPSNGTSTCLALTGNALSSPCAYNTQLVTTNGIASGFWTCAALETATGNINAVGTATAYPTFSGVNTNNIYCKVSQQSK